MVYDSSLNSIVTLSEAIDTWEISVKGFFKTAVPYVIAFHGGKDDHKSDSNGFYFGRNHKGQTSMFVYVTHREVTSTPILQSSFNLFENLIIVDPLSRSVVLQEHL